jgi:hemerythrin-like metal-binding protein
MQERMIMEKFSLSDAYLVGDDLLDAQHKVILSYMAKVYKYLLAGKKEKDVFELVDRLDTYCKLHFLDEENLMEEMDFPEIASHKAQHALFVTHLENFVGRYEKQNITKNVGEFIFLKGWFLEHIEELDKKYADYKKRLDKTAGKSGH